jgi:hypothetical protein
MDIGFASKPNPVGILVNCIREYTCCSLVNCFLYIRMLANQSFEVVRCLAWQYIYIQLYILLFLVMNPEELVQVLSEMRPSFLTLYVTNFLLSNAVGYETDPSLDTVVSTCHVLLEKEKEQCSKSHFNFRCFQRSGCTEQFSFPIGLVWL